jgi:hypothetical protein
VADSALAVATLGLSTRIGTTVRAAEGVAPLAKSAFQLGLVGETALRNAFSIGDKTSILFKGRTIIPDGLNATTLSEVKNVGSLSFTNQLRTYSDFARQNGLSFNLYSDRAQDFRGHYKMQSIVA